MRKMQYIVLTTLLSLMFLSVPSCEKDDSPRMIPYYCSCQCDAGTYTDTYNPGYVCVLNTPGYEQKVNRWAMDQCWNFLAEYDLYWETCQWCQCLLTADIRC